MQPILDDILFETDYRPLTARERASRHWANEQGKAERWARIEARELARAQKRARAERLRAIAFTVGIVGGIALGLAALAWWLVLPGAVGLLGLLLWSAR
jgi:fatty acid desaturase